ncbi:hypothetical protein [Desulfuromonas acetoxidans]|nr:hypothetical protein [Desulfuromonas acetoxidans]
MAKRTAPKALPYCSAERKERRRDDRRQLSERQRVLPTSRRK